MGAKEYPSGFRGKLDSATVQMQRGDDDTVVVNLSDLGINPRIGGASKLENISVRVCEKSTSIIGIYSDSEMNVKGCCVCATCPSGITVCVYGESYCGPGC